MHFIINKFLLHLKFKKPLLGIHESKKIITLRPR
jgi:hypothetical protein